MARPYWQADSPIRRSESEIEVLRRVQVPKNVVQGLVSGRLRNSVLLREEFGPRQAMDFQTMDFEGRSLRQAAQTVAALPDLPVKGGERRRTVERTGGLEVVVSEVRDHQVWYDLGGAGCLDQALQESDGNVGHIAGEDEKAPAGMGRGGSQDSRCRTPSGTVRHCGGSGRQGKTAAAVGDDDPAGDLGQAFHGGLQERLSVDDQQSLVASHAAGLAPGQGNADGCINESLVVRGRHSRQHTSAMIWAVREPSVSNRARESTESVNPQHFIDTGTRPQDHNAKSGTRFQEKTMQAVIKTNKGDIRLDLYPQEAPMTVANFVNLAERGYYDGVVFHRVVPNFVIQGGDPTGTGRGGPGYRFGDECHPSRRHDGAGVLSMANAGPGTNGSQFFITHNATPHLDGRHTVFGRVTEGQDVVDAIAQGDTMQSVAIEGDTAGLKSQMADKLADWNATLDKG